MAKNTEITIPIICENPQCSNFGHLANMVTGIADEDMDLFYENYNGSDEMDYCPVCKELGVAEDCIEN